MGEAKKRSFPLMYIVGDTHCVSVCLTMFAGFPREHTKQISTGILEISTPASYADKEWRNFPTEIFSRVQAKPSMDGKHA